jgi:hypothetical protein
MVNDGFKTVFYYKNHNFTIKNTPDIGFGGFRRSQKIISGPGVESACFFLVNLS